MFKHITKQQIKSVAGVTFGITIMVLGLYFFVIPAKILGGGASGLSLVLSTFIPIPYSIIYLIVNAFLIILGLIMLGRVFSGLTIYATLLTSFGFWVLEQLFPVTHALSNDTIVNAFFGTLISAIGLGITFNCGGSTGGTDILAKILNEYTKLDFSIALLIVDGCVLLATFHTFGMNRGLYALMCVIFNAEVVKRTVVGGEDLFEVTIISQSYQEINKFIFEQLDHSSTMIEATGSYTNAPRKIILTVVSGAEMIALRHYVNDLDDKAFMYVNAVSNVSGLGFSYSKTTSQAPDEFEYNPIELEQIEHPELQTGD